MSNIKLTELVEDDINIVEFYFIKNILSDNVMDVTMTGDIESKINKIYKKTKEEKYKIYYMQDKMYTYELLNDNQYVTSKTKKKDKKRMLKTSERTS